MFEYVDIHSHTYFPDFDHDREAVIEKMRERNIATITVGTDRESSQRALDLAHTYPHFFACVGVHPSTVIAGYVFDSHFENLAHEQKVVAIGECGFDYCRLPQDIQEVEIIKSKQKEIFLAQVELSCRVNKPLMLHVRDVKGSQQAYTDALVVLSEYTKNQKGATLPKPRGNVHFFAGDQRILTEFLAIGFTVSFTGVITFTTDYDELVRATPLELLHAETDAPFVAPAPFRGRRNNPFYVASVVLAMARIKNIEVEVVKKALVDNAYRVFGIR